MVNDALVKFSEKDPKAKTVETSDLPVRDDDHFDNDALLFVRPHALA